MHRGRIDRRSDVHEAQARFAGGQIDLADVAH